MASDKVENERWAVVELMGHSLTAGIIRPSDLGGLLRVDVPIGDGYRTEYLGEASIFRIRITSEEIARAYAVPEREIIAYNEPIVPRAEYEKALYNARQNAGRLEQQVSELQRRLTAVNALPAGNGYEVGADWSQLESNDLDDDEFYEEFDSPDIGF